MLKSRHDGQLRLGIANPPPPPEAKEPAIRRGAEGDGSEYWDARIRVTLDQPKLAETAKPMRPPMKYVGPKTNTCEPEKHLPMHLNDMRETKCRLCGALLDVVPNL
jgi:hypothetical protein